MVKKIGRREVFTALAVLAFLWCAFSLVRIWLLPNVRNSDLSAVAITAVNEVPATSERTGFELNGDEIRLRLRLLLNESPGEGFTVGVIDGANWKPVSQEIQFNDRNATIAFPTAALPAGRSAPIGVFESHGGLCSETLDLLPDPKFASAPIVAFLESVKGCYLQAGLAAALAIACLWLSGRPPRVSAPRPVSTSQLAREVDL